MRLQASRRWGLDNFAGVQTAVSTTKLAGRSGSGLELSFSEELHAIDAVLAGQGIAICSDVVAGHEVRSGTLVQAHPLALPGYGFYVVALAQHVR